MSSPVRLLVVTSDFVGRGAERELANLLTWLPRERFDIHICLWRGVFDYPCPADLPVTILEKHQPWDVFRTRHRFRQLVADLKPQVVFSQLNYVNTVTGSALAGNKTGPAWICRFAGNPQVEIRWPILPWTRSVLKRAVRAAGCSEGACGAITRHLGVPTERVRLLPNVINIAEVKRQSQEPSPVAKKPGSFVFVHAGRLVAQKNQEMLLQAFAALADRSVELWMMGTGPLEKSLRAAADRLALDDRVRWLGHVKNPHSVMREGDAFVLASSYEGLPNAVIEAMLCARPVISTACDFGPAELIEEGRTGLLTPVGDVQSLSAAMRQFAQNPASVRAMGEQASLQMQERYDPEKIVPIYVDLFEEVAKGERA